MRLTHPFWYLAAIALCLTSVMVGVAVAASAWDEVRDATVTSVAKPIEAEGRTLVVYTDQFEDDERFECSIRPADDPEAKVSKLETPALDLTTRSGGTDWTLIAIDTTVDVAGPVAITCAPEDGGTNTSNFGYAVVDGFDAANKGGLIGVAGSVVAAALAAGTFWQRRKMHEAEDAD